MTLVREGHTDLGPTLAADELAGRDGLCMARLDGRWRPLVVAQKAADLPSVAAAERYGPLCLLLDDGGSIPDRATRPKVFDPQSYEVAGAKLAVDGEIEERQLSDCFARFQSNTDRPHVFWLKWALLTDQDTLVPGAAGTQGDNTLPFYRALIDKHHAAMLAADLESAMALREEASNLAVKLNGGEPGILAGDDAPGTMLARRTRAQDNTIPLRDHAYFNALAPTMVAA